MTETHTTDQVAELFQAKLGTRYSGQPQPFHNLRVEATGYVRTHGRHAGAEVFLAHHDGNQPAEGDRVNVTSWSTPGAHAVLVRAGVITYSSGLGATLRTTKALAARERREDAQLALHDALRPAAVLACKALPANAVPEAHGFHLLEQGERAKLQQGSLVLAHGHGRWRVAVVTNVTRTGSVSYLFCTPTAVAEQGAHRVQLTGGTTKAGDNLYGG